MISIIAFFSKGHPSNPDLIPKYKMLKILKMKKDAGIDEFNKVFDDEKINHIRFQYIHDHLEYVENRIDFIKASKEKYFSYKNEAKMFDDFTANHKDTIIFKSLTIEKLN